MKQRKIHLGAILLCLCLTSCLLDSSFPLSNKNNCHESWLEGTWVTESKLSDGNTRTETVAVRDSGSRYSCSQESVEAKRSGEVSSRKTETTDSSFILTKLEDCHFISYLTEKGAYQIFKIQFNGDTLKVFGLNKEGDALAKKEVVYKTPIGRIITKISQPKLQSWCLRHREYFSVELRSYRKLAAAPAPAKQEKR